MNFFHLYFRFIYLVYLFISIVIFPIIAVVIFFLFDPKTDYQLFFEAKFLSYFLVIILCLLISRVINNLRHEKAPGKYTQYLLVAFLTITLLFSTIFGYSVIHQYYTALTDDLPIQTEGKITKVKAIEKNFFGPLDNSLYGQIPPDGKGQLERYAVQFTLDTGHTFQTAYLLSKTDFDEILAVMKAQKGKNVSVTVFPDSKKIVSILSTDEFMPIYKNEFLTGAEK